MPSPGVDIIRVPLVVDNGELDRLHSWLAPDERARAARFLPVVRRRFVACRGRLRTILGGLLGVQPAEVRFHYGPRGKPELADGGDEGWRFNISHSGDVALVALARSDVGIDLEIESPSHDSSWAELVAPSILGGGELREWTGSLPGTRIRSLLATWVAKEAVLKATGVGIGDGFRRLLLFTSLPAVNLVPGGDARPMTLRPTFDIGSGDHRGPDTLPVHSRWCVCNFQTSPGEHAAFAYAAPEVLARVIEYRPDAVLRARLPQD